MDGWMDVGTHVCICVCMYIYAYLHTYPYMIAYIHTCIHTCWYIHTRACVWSFGLGGEYSGMPKLVEVKEHDEDAARRGAEEP